MTPPPAMLDFGISRGRFVIVVDYHPGLSPYGCAILWTALTSCPEYGCVASGGTDDGPVPGGVDTDAAARRLPIGAGCAHGCRRHGDLLQRAGRADSWYQVRRDRAH